MDTWKDCRFQLWAQIYNTSMYPYDYGQVKKMTQKAVNQAVALGPADCIHLLPNFDHSQL